MYIKKPTFKRTSHSQFLLSRNGVPKKTIFQKLKKQLGWFFFNTLNININYHFHLIKGVDKKNPYFSVFLALAMFSRNGVQKKQYFKLKTMGPKPGDIRIFSGLQTKPNRNIVFLTPFPSIILCVYLGFPNNFLL